MTTSPRLNDALYWEMDENRHAMLEAFDLDRDKIFEDFYSALTKAP